MTTTGSSWNAWTYPPGAGHPADAAIDIAGYEVCVVDGRVGTVTEAVFEPGASYVIVDTDGWVLSTTVMLPAAVVTLVGSDRTVHVGCGRQQIYEAPAYRPERRNEPGLPHRAGRLLPARRDTTPGTIPLHTSRVHNREPTRFGHPAAHPGAVRHRCRRQVLLVRCCWPGKGDGAGGLGCVSCGAQGG